MARILVGVAWPYANGPQHIGQFAGNALPADIFVRYQRLVGHEAIMVSGSDMHGTPTTVKAEAEGVDPSVVAERFHQVHVDCFRRLGISFDVYTTTHTALHARTAQGVFLSLLQEGYLEKRSAPAAFCPKHQRFRPDRYVTGTCPHCGNPNARGDECDRCARVLEPQELKDPRCLICGTPVEFRPSEHFYFLLPKLTDALRRYHETVRDHWRPSVRSFTENYLKDGLRPRPITRDIPWGVPLPLEGYADKRLYVWFEAVIGYLSATQEWAFRQKDPEAWKRFWAADAESRVYQFLGKDNITFHTIFWPAILLAVGGLQLPYDVPANEWLVLEGGKMSKSRSGQAASIFLPDLLERFAPDTIRFYGAYHMPQNHDTEFDYDDIAQDHDQILADQWGNYAHRVLSFVQTRYGGVVPTPPAGWSTGESPLGRRLHQAHKKATAHLEAVELKEALDTVLELVREGNRLFHESKPWSLQGAERDRALYEALWGVQAMAVLLAPFLPFSSEKAAGLLDAPELLTPGGWARALVPPKPGTRLPAPSPLFTKLLVASGPPPAQGAGKSPASPPVFPTTGAASPSSTPAELDIRVGVVREVAPHPKADKLYVLKVDLGEGSPRTLVAGIRPFYRPEELQGKAVAVLANLEPRPLRGVTSQGMILAAEAGETVAVLTAPTGTAPGARLKGASPSGRTIPYEEFARAKLVVGSSPGAPIVRLDRQGDDHPEPMDLESGGALVADRPLPAGAKVR